MKRSSHVGNGEKVVPPPDNDEVKEGLQEIVRESVNQIMLESRARGCPKMDQGFFNELDYTIRGVMRKLRGPEKSIAVEESQYPPGNIEIVGVVVDREFSPWWL